MLVQENKIHFKEKDKYKKRENKIHNTSKIIKISSFIIFLFFIYIYSITSIVHYLINHLGLEQ